MTKVFLGELIGTFILVFIGCGTVGLEILFQTFGSLYLIALMWSLGVALAIFSSRKLSGAHLNPAVSLWVYLEKGINTKRLFIDFLAQFLGAFIAAFMLFLLLKSHMVNYDENTAKMFGEFYSTTTLKAFSFELLGTLFLLSGIAVITSRIKPKNLHPILIGLVVGFAIIVVAPYTQCGINPARDLAPRLFSYFAGWGNQAFSQSFLLVYVLAPFSASILFYLLKRLTKF
ncbi:MAG: MIP/aquaporin family protein [Bacteroidia bacterium]